MARSSRQSIISSELFVTCWVGLAVLTLVLAGMLAVSLVVGRTPVVSEWIGDPSFFRRALVVHVVLALWGWFVAYAVGLRILVDGLKSLRRGLFALGLATAGIVTLVVSAGIRGAEPLLVNYIPVIDHPVFFAGLITFFAGVGLILWAPPSFQAPRRGVALSAAIFWRATQPVAVIALVVLVLTWMRAPKDVAAPIYFERLFWGVGHTMQVMSVLVMLGAWLFLLRDREGRTPLGPVAALGLSAGLILPQVVAPFLALAGPTTGAYVVGFTQLMRFGIVIPVLIVMALCLKACWGGSASPGGRLAFLVSALLTVVGFGLGAMIRGSDTMIPAHYHASLGAITVALMALTFALMEQKGWSLQRSWWRRLARVQPLIFGVGQIIFAVGFALGGLFGVDRKSYGSEQVLDSVGAIIGMATMGIGGILAVVGGGAFVGLVAGFCISEFKWSKHR